MLNVCTPQLGQTKFPKSKLLVEKFRQEIKELKVFKPTNNYSVYTTLNTSINLGCNVPSLPPWILLFTPIPYARTPKHPPNNAKNRLEWNYFVLKFIII